MTRKELYEIANKLGIKYLTWMKKQEMINEILKGCDDGENCCKNRYMCEHNKQKYKCVLCGGLHICEHKKQKPACKICNNNLKI